MSDLPGRDRTSDHVLGKLGMVHEPDAPEGTLLVLAVVKQAMSDLDDPAEREDAVAFLTDTLWTGDPEGLPLRDMAPNFFQHEAEVRERIRLMIAGEIDLPRGIESGDGAVSYEDVLDLLLSQVEAAKSTKEG